MPRTEFWGFLTDRPHAHFNSLELLCSFSSRNLEYFALCMSVCVKARAHKGGRMHQRWVSLELEVKVVVSTR